MKVEDVRTPLKIIYAELCKFGIIEMKHDERDLCSFHPDGNHCIEECEEFRQILQKLLDRHLIQVGRVKKDENISTLQSSGDKNTAFPKPLEICYNKGNLKPVLGVLKPITIHVPTPFPFKNINAVPWDYSMKVSMDNLGANQLKEVVGPSSPAITNISGIGGMTRSGRIYTPIGSMGGKTQEEEKARKGKDKEEESTDKDLSKKAKKEEENKKVVSEEEACEFLKFMRQSEYKVVDQLNHTPAKISMLSLLLNSEHHRESLMKVLNEAHVNHDITTNQFDGIVSNIATSNYLNYRDDEISAEGMGHNKALHISVRCGDYMLARVLVDNGSSLNVMPKSTLAKLSVDGSYMKPSTMVVRAFDGPRRQVIGEIELPIQVGPRTFEVVFQVMEIVPAYSCLLRRPWIHTSGVVPSTLNQKLKFIVDNKLVTVCGEEEMLVSKPSSKRYIEAAEKALETSFQALEIANAIFVGEGALTMKPKLSETSMMIAKVMMKGGYQAECGLGRYEQGIVMLVELLDNRNRYSLGYKPSRFDKRRIAKERKEKRKARLEGREPKDENIIIYDIRQSFQSAGMLNPNQIAAIKDDRSAGDDIVDLVYPCPPNEELGNWEIAEFPMIFDSK